MGETRVDLQHLLEDIRDAYPGSLEETIVTEVVANSLDSGAAALRFETDSSASTLTVIDDGSGMGRRDLARYHDIAATTKNRGEGIGFAGVGIKLGLLASEEVLTESRRGKSEVATVWRLASRHKAPWRWMPPSGLVRGQGTAVRLRLRHALSLLLDPGFLESTLRRHFQPLFDPAFDEILAAQYPLGVRVLMNGVPLVRQPEPGGERIPLAVRLGRKRKPAAVGYVVRHPQPLPEGDQGLAVSTHGKVIKRGWDWLGLTPSDPERIAGLVEVPGLAESLTLRRKTRPFERDLAEVLVGVADEFPLVASLIARRTGGQKRLSLESGPVDGGQVPGWGAGEVEAAAPAPREPKGTPTGGHEAAPSASGEEARSPAADAEGDISWPVGPGRRKHSRAGLSIQFESRPDDADLGRLVESTVWVNDAHPAYLRAAASRSEGYHLALAVALALAPLAAEPGQTVAFLTTFLARWGEATARPPRRRRR